MTLTDIHTIIATTDSTARHILDQVRTGELGRIAAANRITKMAEQLHAQAESLGGVTGLMLRGHVERCAEELAAQAEQMRRR